VSDANPPPASKLPLLIVFITVFIDLLGFGIVLPLLPRYGEYYHANKLVLGLLTSSFSAMQFVFAPIWGRLSDRIGRRPILLLGLLGSTGSYALFGYASGFPADANWLGLSMLGWLFVSRIGAGIAGATIPTAQAYIADSTGVKDRGKGMALIGLAFGIGFVFGPLLGAMFLGDEETGTPDWRPGAVASVLSGSAFLFALLKLPESLRLSASVQAGTTLPVRTSFLHGLSKIAARRDICLTLASMFLTVFAFAQFESTLSLLTEVLGQSAKKNYFAFAYLGVILLVCQGLIVRRLMPKWGQFRLAAFGAVLMTIGLPLIAWAGYSMSMSRLYVVMPLTVMGFAALTPSLNAMLSLQSSESDQGEILGFGQSASAFARILGPLSGLYLFGFSPSYPYVAGGALMGLGLVCVWMVNHRPKM
jgi:DHA1 family tetracycline resistance protein-like MFS transporter